MFDDPNLVSAAGLVPVLQLADRAGLRDLAQRQLSVPPHEGANAGLKVASLVAGMVAGADSIACLGVAAARRHEADLRPGLRLLDAGLVPAGLHVWACAAARRGRVLSGKFCANAAWLVCAVIAFNLARAAAALTGPTLAKATTATIRRKLIRIPARVARSARQTTLHLPQRWPWHTEWTTLFTRVCRPPTPATT